MARRILWLLIIVLVISSAVGLRMSRNWIADDTLQEEIGAYRKLTPEKRGAAVGRVSEIPKPIRHFFNVAEDYAELPHPRANDWLANHAEDGQTYPQFVRSKPNLPSKLRHKICLLPVGELRGITPAEQELLREFTASYFMLETVWLSPIKIDETRMPFKVHEDNRRQLYSEDALRALIDEVPDDAFCVLAVTLEDLVPHGAWNFVFGQASYRDRVGIFSFLRFDPKFYGEASDASTDLLVVRRRCGVLAHEIGHMFGIKHCIHYHCLMNGSNSLPESDAAPLHLCPVCLRKLQQSVGFDVAERERKLANVFKQLGLETESQWHQRRLDRSPAQ